MTKKKKPDIPFSFQLFGEHIRVLRDDAISAEGVNGICLGDLNLIKISISGIDVDCAEACFYHELVHMILKKIDEDDLCCNERFVTNFAGLLYQFLKTKK
jgi:hypothetical protein